MSSSCIFEMVKKNAMSSPQTLSLFSPDKFYLSYKELIDKSCKLKQVLDCCLLNWFQQADDENTTPLILLKSSRYPSILVGILGIFASDGAYVPIDPELPTVRQELIAETSEAKVAIIDETCFQDMGYHRSDLIDWLKSDRFSRSSLRLGSHVEYVIVVDIMGEVLCKKDFGHNSLIEMTNPTQQVALFPGRLAYVMFTSGSTGKPKGVRIGVEALLSVLGAFHRLLKLRSYDCLLAVTTFSFDISILELLYPLTIGASVLLAPLSTTRNGMELCQLLSESSTDSSTGNSIHGGGAPRMPKVTIMQATPATWKMVVNAGWNGNLHVQVLCGGEAFPSDVLSPLVDKCKSVFNFYGPTEATIWCLVHKLESIQIHATFASNTDKDAITKVYDSVPIGQELPYEGISYQVMDMNHPRQEVSDGVVGELVIGGPGVALGYTDTIATNNSFNEVLDELGSKKRFYRTGDLVVRHPQNKLLYFAKRKEDSQVKINGYRIEVGDIESSIRSIGGIRLEDIMPNADSGILLAIVDCAVVAVEHAPSSPISFKKLACFVVLRISSRKAEDQLKENVNILPWKLHVHLRNLLTNKLPVYMIPTKWIFYMDRNSKLSVINFKVNSLPLNSNGKLDRSELVKRAYSSPQSSELKQEIVESGGSITGSVLLDMIEVVKAAVQHVLFDSNEMSSDTFDIIHDDLDLESMGITSIGVVQFLNQVSLILSHRVEVSPITLTQHKTARQFAAYLVQERQVDSSCINVRLVPSLLQVCCIAKSEKKIRQSRADKADQQSRNKRRNKSNTSSKQTNKDLDVGIKACKEGRLDIILALLDRNSQKVAGVGTLDKQEVQGESLMLPAHWDVDTVDRFGSPGLHWAASGGFLSLCQVLVEKGKANVKKKDKKSGRSALHWAARQGQLHVVQWLVEEQGLSVHENTNV